MDPIGILGIVLSVALAIWQYQKAQSAEKHLHNLLHSLPLQLTENVARILNVKDNPKQTSTDNIVQTRFLDLNSDGKDELLVQFPFSAHASFLQVYGFKGWEFQLIAEISTDTPLGFEYEDVDSDGKLEIKTIETNRSSGLPFVMGLRDVVWYKLDGENFVEIKRIEPSQKEIQDRISESK